MPVSGISRDLFATAIANVGGSAEHSIANDRPRPGTVHGIEIEGDRGAAGRLRIQEARRQGQRMGISAYSRKNNCQPTF